MLLFLFKLFSRVWLYKKEDVAHIMNAKQIKSDDEILNLLQSITPLIDSEKLSNASSEFPISIYYLNHFNRYITDFPIIYSRHLILWFNVLVSNPFDLSLIFNSTDSINKIIRFMHSNYGQYHGHDKVILKSVALFIKNISLLVFHDTITLKDVDDISLLRYDTNKEILISNDNKFKLKKKFIYGLIMEISKITSKKFCSLISILKEDSIIIKRIKIKALSYQKPGSQTINYLLTFLNDSSTKLGWTLCKSLVRLTSKNVNKNEFVSVILSSLKNIFANESMCINVSNIVSFMILKGCSVDEADIEYVTGKMLFYDRKSEFKSCLVRESGLFLYWSYLNMIDKTDCVNEILKNNNIIKKDGKLADNNEPNESEKYKNTEMICNDKMFNTTQKLEDGNNEKYSKNKIIKGINRIKNYHNDGILEINNKNRVLENFSNRQECDNANTIKESNIYVESKEPNNGKFIKENKITNEKENLYRSNDNRKESKNKSEKFITLILQNTILVSIFDNSLNCRRAASTVLLEIIGRFKYNFGNAITDLINFHTVKRIENLHILYEKVIFLVPDFKLEYFNYLKEKMYNQVKAENALHFSKCLSVHLNCFCELKIKLKEGDNEFLIGILSLFNVMIDKNMVCENCFNHEAFLFVVNETILKKIFDSVMFKEITDLYLQFIANILELKCHIRSVNSIDNVKVNNFDLNVDTRKGFNTEIKKEDANVDASKALDCEKYKNDIYKQDCNDIDKDKIPDFVLDEKDHKNSLKEEDLYKKNNDDCNVKKEYLCEKKINCNTENENTSRICLNEFDKHTYNEPNSNDFKKNIMLNIDFNNILFGKNSHVKDNIIFILDKNVFPDKIIKITSKIKNLDFLKEIEVKFMRNTNPSYIIANIPNFQSNNIICKKYKTIIESNDSEKKAVIIKAMRNIFDNSELIFEKLNYSNLLVIMEEKFRTGNEFTYDDFEKYMIGQYGNYEKIIKENRITKNIEKESKECKTELKLENSPLNNDLNMESSTCNTNQNEYTIKKDNCSCDKKDIKRKNIDDTIKNYFNREYGIKTKDNKTEMLNIDKKTNVTTLKNIIGNIKIEEKDILDKNKIPSISSEYENSIIKISRIFIYHIFKGLEDYSVNFKGDIGYEVRKNSLLFFAENNISFTKIFEKYFIQYFVDKSSLLRKELYDMIDFEQSFVKQELIITVDKKKIKIKISKSFEKFLFSYYTCTKTLKNKELILFEEIHMKSCLQSFKFLENEYKPYFVIGILSLYKNCDGYTYKYLSKAIKENYNEIDVTIQLFLTLKGRFLYLSLFFIATFFADNMDMWKEYGCRYLGLIEKIECDMSKLKSLKMIEAIKNFEISKGESICDE